MLFPPALPINASIIHGFPLGPVKYVFTDFNLHPITLFNQFCKYADDTYILASSYYSPLTQSEIQRISDLATANNLQESLDKRATACVYEGP